VLFDRGNDLFFAVTLLHSEISIPLG
jgi:hypothetical protein